MPQPFEDALVDARLDAGMCSARKIVAATLETDRLGFLQSIGVVPPNEALFAPRAEPAAAPLR